MMPGPTYRAAFPEYGDPVAAADIASLVAFGFPQAVIDAWAGDIPTLNQLQLEAINEYGVLRGEHLVASAPTSSGKTMIGELAAIRGARDRRRTLFLMPLKALVNDKVLQFRRVYGPFGIQTVEATGESDDVTPLLRGQFDIALLTYEKFTALALTHPHESGFFGRFYFRYADIPVPIRWHHSPTINQHTRNVPSVVSRRGSWRLHARSSNLCDFPSPSHSPGDCKEHDGNRYKHQDLW